MNICSNCKTPEGSLHNCQGIIKQNPEEICQCFCGGDSIIEDDVEIIINSRPKSFFDILLVIVVISAVVAFAVYKRMNT